MRFGGFREENLTKCKKEAMAEDKDSQATSNAHRPCWR